MFSLTMQASSRREHNQTREKLGRSCALSLFVFLTITSKPSAQTITAIDVQREIVGVFQEALDTLRRRDRTSYDRLVTPDFAFAHSTGNVDDKAMFFVWGTNNAPESVTFDDPVKLWTAGDLAVMTGVSQTRGRAGGAAIPFRGTDVFRKSAAGWQWAFHQSTQLPPPLTPIALDDSVLGDYLGTYIDERGTKGIVGREGERLTIVYGSRPTLTLDAETASTFRSSSFGGVRIVFLRGTSGQVANLEIHQFARVEVLRRATTP